MYLLPVVIHIINNIKIIGPKNYCRIDNQIVTHVKFLQTTVDTFETPKHVETHITRKKKSSNLI